MKCCRERAEMGINIAIDRSPGVRLPTSSEGLVGEEDNSDAYTKREYLDMGDGTGDFSRPREAHTVPAGRPRWTTECAHLATDARH